MARREYGTGSVYQAHAKGCEKPTNAKGETTCGCRWVGSKDHGWNANGKRRRLTVVGKTKGQAQRRLRDKIQTVDRGGRVTGSRITVKGWADTYLERRVHELSPKGYNAAANPLRNWVIPTIGHRRLDQLGPDDIRDVHNACRKGGRSTGDVHRALHTMLQDALANGHPIAPSALAVGAPKQEKSDRAAMTVPEGLAALEVASTLPHGVRWIFTLVYGARLGECLGMTWDAVDLRAGEAMIEWQLQSLPYNKPRDRSSGFRVPDGYECRHLVDAFHLVRPKSRAGYRVAPLLPPIAEAMRDWRAIAPANPWGLVWPTLDGRPANDKHDREEWHALQGTAGIGHPAGRPYHVHECRNFAATMLLEADVPEHVITDLLGHSSLAVSLRYRTRRREPLMEGLTRVGERLQLGR